MIWHPLVAAICVIDIATLVVLAHAAYIGIKVLLYWETGSPSPVQLHLEALVDTASYSGRLVLVLQAGAALLLVIAISHVLPSFVPGAMCGTGVIQATGTLGWKALIFRALALLMLWLWFSIDSVNRRHPTPPLPQEASRFVVASVPFVALAIWSTLQAVYGLNLHEPVNCCTVVYDQVSVSSDVGAEPLFSDTVLVSATVLTLLVTVFLTLWVAIKPLPLKSCRYPFLMISGVAWVFFATLALVHVFASYHYGVLYHHCPWCLFLPEHSMVGYPLFAGLFLVFAESITMAAISGSCRNIPQDQKSATLLIRRKALILGAGIATYLALGIAPVLWWRLSYGVWMH